MTYTDKHIVKTYFGLFEGLNPISKLELIELLSKSLKTEWTTKENNENTKCAYCSPYKCQRT